MNDPLVTVYVVLDDLPRAPSYLSGPLSLSRFNQRLHRLVPWPAILLDLPGKGFAGSAVSVIDSLPLPVCRRARARRRRRQVPSGQHSAGGCTRS